MWSKQTSAVARFSQSRLWCLVISSYIVGGTRAFFQNALLPNPTIYLLSIWWQQLYGELYMFYLMATIIWMTIYFQFYGELYMFYFKEIYMFLFHVETNAFSIAWRQTTGSLKFSEKQEVLKFSEKQTVLAELVWRPTQLCRDVTSSYCIMSVSETIDSTVCYISFIVEAR